MPTLSRTTLFLLLTLTTLFGYEISGTIKDAQTGAPIIAASITDAKTKENTFSDERGSFTMNLEFRKNATISISAVGYKNYDYTVTGTDKRSITLEKIDITKEFCDTCPGTKLIMGEIVDGEIEKGIADVSISTNGKELTTSDENGFFSFVSKAVSQKVTLTHSDYNDTSVTVEATKAEKNSNTIRWMPTVLRSSLAGSMSGVVKDSTKTLSDVTITVLNDNSTVKSNSKGTFAITKLLPGKYTIMATKSGYVPNVFSISVEEKEKIHQTIVLEKRATHGAQFSRLMGVIKDSEGNVVSAGFARIDSLNKEVQLGADGSFAFDSLPSGVYSLTFWAEGSDTTTTHDIDLWEGESKKEEFKLKKLSMASKLVYNKGMGAVTGLIVAAADGKPLSGANITLKNVTTGKSQNAVAEMDGNFSVMAKRGTYDLVVSSAGFTDKTIKELTITEGEAQKLDLLLDQSDVTTMAKISVRGVAVKSGSAALLKERQQTFEVVDAVGSEQFKKAGASNAADAMKAVTGVTIVNDKYVVIRGLPPKYSVVMLNNTILPSADPDEQAVHMDMFPAGIIDNIMVYKTFQSVNPANFAGGVVNINTKPFPDEATWKVSLSGTINSRGTFNDNFLTSKDAGSEFFGFAGKHREAPGIIANTTKDAVEEHTKWVSSFSVAKNIKKGREESVNFVEEYSKSVSEEMTPITKTANPNLSFAASYGNSHTYTSGAKLGYNLSLTYKNERKMKENVIERSWGVNGSDQPLKLNKDFTVNDSKEKVLWSFLGNTSFKPKDEHRFSLDYLFLQSGENKIKSVSGLYPNSEISGTPFYSSRLHYIERTMNYLKSAGEHTLYIGNNTPSVLWQGSFTNSIQDEPDMRDIYDYMDSTGIHSYVRTMAEPSHSWRTVNSKQGTADIGFKIPFWQWSDDSATITTGVAWQGLGLEQDIKRVKYDIYSYYDRLKLGKDKSKQNIMKEHSMDYFMQQQNMGTVYDTSVTPAERIWGLTLKDDSRDVAQRKGNQHIFSQYAQVEIPFYTKLSGTFGIRGEKAHILDETKVEEKKVDSLAAKLDDYDVLPSAMITAKPTDNIVIKGGYGKTLVRPSIRQKAEYLTESFTGGGSFVGNRKLERSFIHNFDVRAEYFPNPGDLIAIGGFFKRVKNPIEETFLDNDVVMPENSSSDANILGVEIEFIKGWRDLGMAEHFFEINSNFTLVKSEVKLNEDNKKLPNYFPKDDGTRPFQGQSPVVANLFLTYGIKKIGLSNTLYYNVFGTRLGALTAREEPYLWEKPYHQLNLTVSKDIGERMKLSFKAKNLLDATKTLYMDFSDGEGNEKEYIKHESKKGIDFSLGLSYTF